MSETRHIRSAPIDLARADDLVARLRRVLPAEAIISGAACAPYAVAGKQPSVVALPGDSDSVGAALAVAAEAHAAVVPWGGGTRQALGYPPRRYDLALSLARLNAVLEYDPTNLSVTAQAGITHAALAQTLAAAGQMLPLDVAQPRIATLGGTLACDTPGLRWGHYGGARALTQEVRARGFASDTASTQSTGSTGMASGAAEEDHGLLHIGALGTLGVIVEARLSAVPQPETEITLLGIFASLVAALEAVPALASLAPSTSALAIIRASALPSLAQLAPAHGGRALLAIGLSGALGDVTLLGQMGRGLLRRAGARTILTVEPEVQGAFWNPVLDSTQLAHRSPANALLRVEGVPTPGEISEIVSESAGVAAAHDLTVAELADALGGTVWLRLRAAADGEDAAPDTARVLGDGLAALCAALRTRWPRTTLLDAPPELMPRLAVWGAPAEPAVVAAHQRLDPAGLLNPGRYPLDPPSR
jgi:FAD/FMN-containing dehydrogenase